MKIKELLRAHRLSSARAHEADTVKARETEFDMITVIAKKLRALRKGDKPSQEPITGSTDDRT
ncbi:hypothetical protein [Erythrobacter sp.]|jgi:hypothetical protein|uniref:hypothetical protein n=1 Tax=Erythrobacter sp. TaxID=1042 RepID=UPI002EBBE42A|nr:hypothetical protein [Erythrobacter sp.]